MKNNLKGYKIVFENALLEMRDFCHFDKKASKTYPCNDAIVVLVPYFFSSSDVDVLAEVANKKQFSEKWRAEPLQPQF